MTTTVYVHTETPTVERVLGEPGHRHISVRPAEGVSIICATIDELTALAAACVTAANLLAFAQSEDAVDADRDRIQAADSAVA